MEVKTKIFLGDCKEGDTVFDHFYIQNNKLLFK